jgi:hypothetical protein
MLPTELPNHYRAKAQTLERFAPAAAEAFREAAEELEQAQSAFDHEPLTLTAAASESPYTADWLGKLIKQGKLPNAGRPNAPRILRKHLREYSLHGEVETPAPVVTATHEPSPRGTSAASLGSFRSRAINSRKRS